MCYPKVGNFYDKSTYLKTQENLSFVFEGNCPKLNIFALLFFCLDEYSWIFSKSVTFHKWTSVSQVSCVYIHGKLNLSVIPRSSLLLKINLK